MYLERLDRAALTGVVILMAALFILVITQIMVRAIGISLPETEEMTRYTLAWITSFATYPWPGADPAAAGTNPQLGRIRTLAGTVLALTVIAAAAAGYLWLAVDGAGQRLTSLPFAMSWVYGGVCAILVLSAAARLIRLRQ